MEMRVIDYIIHPDYYEDGKSKDMFMKGTDIAFAVVEIPNEKYRSMKKNNEVEEF